jgi:iron complex outermembrane receptor protein
MKKLSVLILVFLCANSYALTDEERARLEALRSFSLEDLQELDVKLDDVFDMFDGLVKARKVSVASGVSQDTGSAPAVTTLITAQDIEAIGARTLDEALEMVPGLHVGKRGAGYDAIYTMRGIHTNPSPEVLFLLNGTPFKNAFDGRAPTDIFPVSVIQRIEVIRGPGSALYGADAFAGVINIITKNAADIQGTELGARAGAFQSRNIWLQHGGQYGAVDFAVMLDWAKSDGYDGRVEEDAQTQFDAVFGQYGAPPASQAPGALNTQRDLLHLYLDAGFGKHWRWRGSLRQNKNAGRGLGISQALDPENSTSTANSDNFSTDLTYHNTGFAANWVLQAQLAYQYIDGFGDYTMFPPGAFGGAFPEGFFWQAGNKSDELRLESNALFRGWSNHALRVGAGWQQSRLRDVTARRNWGMDLASGMPYPLGDMQDFSNSADAFILHTSRRNTFAYLQDSWAFHSDWELTAGIRYDEFSDFGSTTNPRLALVWKTTPTLTTKFLFGSAFRAPYFLELGLNNPLLGIGNPGLQAETIDTYELAWDWFATPDLHLTLNLFHYQIKDKIGFPGGQYQYANYGEWDGQGFEFEARWKLSARAALLFNYAYQDNEDETGEPVADALRQSAYARLDWMFMPNWFLDINARWIADRPRAANDWREDMDDYFVTDLTLRRKDIKGQWNFALGVRNVFDADVREPTTVNIGVTNDLPLAGREWFAEIRYRF